MAGTLNGIPKRMKHAFGHARNEFLRVPLATEPAVRLAMRAAIQKAGSWPAL
jgi:hypothetical protein